MAYNGLDEAQSRSTRQTPAMFDYYPETDTLIISFRRWPEETSTYSSGPFTVVVSSLGDLVELEIRNASRFFVRAKQEGIPLPENDG